MLNKVQKVAYEQIRQDSVFLYSITLLNQNPNINSNYSSMLQPYIGVYADGSEQWSRKAGLKAPAFKPAEKKYYTLMRQSHKIFSLGYNELKSKLQNLLLESDTYFSSICSPLAKELNIYDNVGVDVCQEQCCGNTILCSIFTPNYTFGHNDGDYIKSMSIIAGRIAATFGCNKQKAFQIDDSMRFSTKDFHFFAHCPIRMKSFDGFVLFSILCAVNFVRLFIDRFFRSEFPFKLRTAYLLYYYLCDILTECNNTISTNFMIDTTWKNNIFRNCMAHYGLGQIMEEDDIIEGDMTGGLTQKVFKATYSEIKNCIFSELDKVAQQIEDYIF